MKLFAAGLSHKTAPVELREQLSVQRSEVVDLARALKSSSALDEVALLSTCNRVEVYGTTQRRTIDIKSLFESLSPKARDLDLHIYLHEDADAVRHLFRVTAGLDSMVLGETEITGQIKNAYEIACNAGLTGRVLNRLFQRAFQATKEIRTRTGIGRGTVSIKSTAVELIGKTDLSQQSIMVLAPARWRRVAFIFWSKKVRDPSSFRVVPSTAPSIWPRAVAARRFVSVVPFSKCARSMLSSPRGAARRRY
jgi:glutamyl-tRNA reductase